MDTSRRRIAAVASAVTAVVLLAGCGAGDPVDPPTIGSPSPTTPTVTADPGRAEALAREYGLYGADLPEDWPDIPLPRDTEVITAYAIGAEPRRTWTATFAADRGTALDLAEPVVAALRERGYQPIAEYVGPATTNTGLYSFSTPSLAVYVVLGEDDGRPNLVITVRGTSDPDATLPPDLQPSRPASGPAEPVDPQATGDGTQPEDDLGSDATPPASPEPTSGTP